MIRIKLLRLWAFISFELFLFDRIWEADSTFSDFVEPAWNLNQKKIDFSS